MTNAERRALEIERRALEIWREREMQFPERARRMNPDAIDMATGAWHACLFKAVSETALIPNRGKE